MVARWTDGWMNVWVDGCWRLDGRRNGWVARWTGGGKNGWNMGG